MVKELKFLQKTIQKNTSIHDNFFEAYFVKGLNIGLEEVILDVVSNSGLDINEARSVIKDRTFKKNIDEDWKKSSEYGVTGVPTFVYSGQSLVGAQPYENLVQFLNHFAIKKLQFLKNISNSY